MKREKIVVGGEYTNDRKDQYNAGRRVIRIKRNETYPILSQVFYEVVAGYAKSGGVGTKGQVSLPQFAKWALREVSHEDGGVKKVELFFPRLDEVLRGSYSKDAQRNYLGFVYKEDLYAFQDAIIDRAAACGLKITRTRRYHDEWDRLYFHPEPEIAHLFEHKENPIEVCLLFEKPITGYDEKGYSIYDYDRLMLFVGFTIKKKNLTFFRNFLLKNIFTLEEEAKQ